MSSMLNMIYYILVCVPPTQILSKYKVLYFKLDILRKDLNKISMTIVFGICCGRFESSLTSVTSSICANLFRYLYLDLIQLSTVICMYYSVEGEIFSCIPNSISPSLVALHIKTRDLVRWNIRGICVIIRCVHCDKHVRDIKSH